MLGSSARSGSITGIDSMTGIGSDFTSPVVQFDSILAIINYPSYMMLTDPPSKVSVPLPLLILTLSKVAGNSFAPATI